MKNKNQLSQYGDSETPESLVKSFVFFCFSETILEVNLKIGNRYIKTMNMGKTWSFTWSNLSIVISFVIIGVIIDIIVALGNPVSFYKTKFAAQFWTRLKPYLV